MAPRKKKPQVPESSQEQSKSLFDAIFKQASKRLGTNQFYVGSATDEIAVGIPLPALSLRYLFQSTVYPLSRFAVVTGLQGSGKSPFIYEVFRWHRMSCGTSALLECEQKDSPTLRASILNYDDEACLPPQKCFSQEDWQKGLTTLIDTYQEGMEGTEASPGPGRIYPFCIGIDSLSAKSSQESIDKIFENGFADRSFPVEALKLAGFIRAWPQRLADWPISVVATNHLKLGKDDQMRVTRNSPGGGAPKFQESYEIEMSFVQDVRRASYEGIEVSITTRKNSLGPSRRKINTRLLWSNRVVEIPGVDDDEKPSYVSVQRTYWDWHTTSMEILLEFKEKNKNVWGQIEKMLDLHPEKSKGNVVWSEALGIERENALPYAKAAEILESRTDIMEYIHAVLAIEEHPVFQPGIDFRQQLEQSSPRLAAKLSARKMVMDQERAEKALENNGTSDEGQTRESEEK